MVRSLVPDYDFEDNWPRPNGSSATSCQQSPFSRTNINSSTMDLAFARKLRPALPREPACRARLLIRFRLQNREMRNIGPILFAAQSSAAELIVQFTHPISSPLHLDEHRRSRRQKCFHVSQFDAEGNDAATSLFQKFQCGRFGSRPVPAEEEW